MIRIFFDQMGEPLFFQKLRCILAKMQNNVGAGGLARGCVNGETGLSIAAPDIGRIAAMRL